LYFLPAFVFPIGKSDLLSGVTRVSVVVTSWAFSSHALVGYCRRRVKHIQQQMASGANGEEQLREWQSYIWILVEWWVRGYLMTGKDILSFLRGF